MATSETPIAPSSSPIVDSSFNDHPPLQSEGWQELECLVSSISDASSPIAYEDLKTNHENQDSEGSGSPQLDETATASFAYPQKSNDTDLSNKEHVIHLDVCAKRLNALEPSQAYHLQSRSTQRTYQFTRPSVWQTSSIDLKLDVFVENWSPRSAGTVKVRIIGWSMNNSIDANSRQLPISFIEGHSYVPRGSNSTELDIRGALMYIIILEVSPMFHRLGIARAMVDFLVEWAKAEGVTSAHLIAAGWGEEARLADGRRRADVFWNAMGFLEQYDHQYERIL